MSEAMQNSNDEGQFKISDAESIIPVSTDGEGKCSKCGYRVNSLYRLESEADDIAICGSCMTEWIISEGLLVLDPSELSGDTEE